MSEPRKSEPPVDSGREAGDGRPAKVEQRERRETTRGRATGRGALGLFGVTFSEGRQPSPVTGVELVVVRELAAIVAPTPYSAQEPTSERVLHAGNVVTAFAAQGPVLPAPIGVVFRSRDAVVRWLELHYVALSDALSFVDDRVVGRVHVYRPGSKPSEEETGSDVASVAAETLRELRRSAVATVPLRVEQITGIVLSAAFLIEQELWKDFASKVEEQATRVPNIRLELTGPWPPYDFVQMQFGS